MALELLFLGTGTSAGVPMIGCGCDVCRSHDPRDNRTRPSVLIRYPLPGGSQSDAPADQPEPPGRCVCQYLIDTAPDLRTQMIRHDIKHLDGVLYTHTHADHVYGIDDLRRFNAVMQRPLAVYAERSAHEVLRSMFSYIFEPHKHANGDKTFVPILLPELIDAGMPLELNGARWTPLRLLHGRRAILGFRVDYRAAGFVDGGADGGGDGGSGGVSSLAYCTDVSSIPPETYPLLEGLDVLVIDALRYLHHPTHMTVDRALETIEQVKPRRAYLTHIAHDIQHADLEAKLPEHVFLAFDGLTVDVAERPVPTDA